MNVLCKADLARLAAGSKILYEADEDDAYQRLIFFPEGGAAI